MLKRLHIWALLVCLLLAAAVHGQQNAPAKRQTLPELQAEIAKLLDQPKFASMRWGVRILTDKGTLLFERDADKSFTPASNMKLCTTAAVLDALGPDFKIRTSVYASRPVTPTGVLQGDLVFYGRGDTNLSARFDDANPKVYGEFYAADQIAAIEQLADQLTTAGLKQVTGNVVGDDSYFAADKLGIGWEWDDVQFYSGAEISALTTNDNVIQYVVSPAVQAKRPPSIGMKPRTGFSTIINHATTSANGQSHIGVNRPLDTNRVEFFGSIPVNAAPFKVNIAVHGPAAFAATLLKEALERRGIRVQGHASSIDAIARVDKPFDATRYTELASIQSRPLSEIVKVTNTPSQNLDAELLLLQLGASNGVHELDVYGRPKPTIEQANEARLRFLQKAGIDTTGLSLRDGSGMSRQSLVTPRATSTLLQYMLTHPQGRLFRESLAVAGVEGTLQSRMRGTEGAVQAKTGSLTYTNALSGYLTTARGRLLIFSMFGNNYTNGSRDVTSAMDQICNLLAGFDGELEP